MSNRPSNATLRPVAEYLPERRGHAMFHALVSATFGELAGERAVVQRSPEWHGWSRPLQRMKGAAAATALGSARAIAPKSSHLAQETSATSDGPTAAIFRARMERGRR